MSNRREFLKLGAAAVASTTLPRAEAVERTRGVGTRPNVVLILADDMGFSDIGCFGSEIGTPNLDKLAARGIRLSQFYNNPRCCPSRASIMTGLYPHQAGMGDMVSDHGRYPFAAYDGILSSSSVTVAEALKSSGYATAMVGKWHLAPETDEGKRSWPLQRGFDHFYGMIPGASVYYQTPHLMDGNTPLPPPPKEQYLTDLWTDHAVSLVGQLAKDKKPFFLYAAYNAPHWPIQAPEEDTKKYAARYNEGWDKVREDRHRKQIALGLLKPEWALTPRDARVPAWAVAEDRAWESRRMAVYAAMIERLDRGVGSIVEALERAGVAQNTLIVFFSDNGGNAEELGRGKSLVPNRFPEGPPHTTAEQSAHGPCQIGMTCAGNVPGVMPGGSDSFQSLGIPWGNCTTVPFRLYKHYAHEGGISSPFVACWPSVIHERGSISNALSHVTDLMPTLLEISGGFYPEGRPSLAGESLLPIFAKKRRERKAIFWEHEGNKAVRIGRWKLVSRFPEGWELFDMEADRTELHNLAASQPKRVEAMAAKWQAWAEQCDVQKWPMPQTPANERSGEMSLPAYLRS